MILLPDRSSSFVGIFPLTPNSRSGASLAPAESPATTRGLANVAASPFFTTRPTAPSAICLSGSASTNRGQRRRCQPKTPPTSTMALLLFFHAEHLLFPKPPTVARRIGNSSMHRRRSAPSRTLRRHPPAIFSSSILFSTGCDLVFCVL